MHRCILCVLVLTVLALATYSFGLQGYLEHYTEEDGLAGNYVRWVCVEGDGTKWFGHNYPENRVSRFDELDWESFVLNHNSIVDMTLDCYGRVWVALLFTPGFAYLENGVFHEIGGKFPPIPGGTAVMFDGEGDLWAGGWLRDSPPYTGFVGRSGDDCVTWTSWWDMPTFPWDLDVDLQRRVWFAGHEGLYRQTLNGDSWERIDDLHLHLGSGYNNYRVLVSETGRIWVERRLNGQDGPMMIIYSDDDPEHVSWTRLEFPESLESGIRGILNSVDVRNGIWFAGQDAAAALWYDYADWRLLPFHNRVYCAAVDDKTSDVWFGSSDGVYVLRGGPDAWPPVWIELVAVRALGSDLFSLKGNAEFQMELELDLYVAAQLPDGSLLFAPSWTPAMVPLVRGLDVPIGLTLEDFTVLTLDLANVPAGTYRWYAACTYTGTMEFASNIASCEWQFVK